MALKVDFGSAFSDAEKDILKIEKAMLNQLIRAAEKFVTDAREKVNVDPGLFPTEGPAGKPGIYLDRTANLKNSIGYVIYKNGAPIKENISSPEARLALTHVRPKAGYVLVGVAGMNYASYLESMGYNVITSQGIILIKDLHESLHRIL